jgi:Protein of unknown function (DUF2798)
VTKLAGQSLKLPKRFGPLIFGVIQSCLTSAVASAVAHSGEPVVVFVGHWTKTWFLSWMMTLPLVMLAAPLIRGIVNRVTGERA